MLTLPLPIAFLAWCPLAASQITLGELLDAGASRLSAEDFREQVVQRIVVGSTPSGGIMEIIYVGSGSIQGAGKLQAHEASSLAPIAGAWTTDAKGRVCTEMRISAGGTGGPVSGVVLPSR